MTSVLLLYGLLALGFWVYSYGFVDFNLTLSSHPAVTGFVGWAQQLAMFQRGTSLVVYLIGCVTLFVIYAISVVIVRQKSEFPWKSVIVIALVFTFSYTLLSSDVFKYLFAARMVVDYQANPHVVPPNAFPDDTWIRFMRWVHTPSPYGPGMTGLSIVAYLAGLKKFVLSLYLSKIIALGFYLVAIKMVGLLSAMMTKDKHKIVQSQLFFALNPLVLVEWLANVHNDGPMLSLYLVALYALVQGKKLSAGVALIFSVAVKYITVILVPFFLVKKASLPLIVKASLVGFAVAPLLYHYSYQYQPWYVTWLVPLAAIFGSGEVMVVVAAYTIGALLRYIPFIATGLWQGTQLQFALLTFLPPALALGGVALRRLSAK